MNQTYIVVEKWVKSYENPIILKKGAEVIVDPSVVDSDPEWANWIWCIASDSRDGWVPIQILKTTSSTTDEKYSSIVLEDYSADELSVAEGELLHGSRILNGWLWCCKENSETKGWVPLRNLKLILLKKMMIETPLVDKDYLLIKTEGKGGWTFAEIPDIPMPKTSFGMLKVKGKIDNYEFSNVHLMPIGNGYIGLAVKAEIRKKIKKQAGDTVRITLYEDKMPTEIPEELILCMKYEDGVFEKFERYSDGEKKGFVNWIYSAKMEQTKVDRIAKTIRMIQNGEKFYNWKKE